MTITRTRPTARQLKPGLRRALAHSLPALAVVFALFTTSGWTVAPERPSSGALAADLAAWRRGRVDGRALPDPASSPDRLAAFFASLTPRERRRLAHSHPLAVGNMNGAPVTLRYYANRLALGDALRAERARPRDPRLTEAGRRDAGRRLHRFASLMAEDRDILAFDPDGGGRVAEVFGDLAHADRIAVVVPGAGTDLLTFQRTARSSTAPVGMALALRRAERQARPEVRTAVIAWADYTAPDGVGVDAATASLAASGAVRLSALVGALPGEAPVALFCHSYGSVVCGLAARWLPDRVTDIAVAGSPGMRAEHASLLGTRARIWAVRGGEDWIADLPHVEVGGLGHGADPVSPEFGARVLSAEGAEGHAGYFAPGSESLRNFALIAAGAPAAVRCAREEDPCGTLPTGGSTV
ncbi:alpha/beta hydrolase [Streptomyces abyssomicinicus]|uniref:alpha/beta hydrolase n=1 Tax=Streptomyces abyssomicinicus TaxID=574929 RepID=UPI00124FBE37|nr:alpha/beta hydrolase [Streptomyces abyssomicinicus]